MPLKGIPAVISPDLLRSLALLGHGDEIVLADCHFPSASIAKASKTTLIRADGIPIPTLLDAILRLIELDNYVFSPVTLMEVVEQDKVKFMRAEIWQQYQELVDTRAGRTVNFSYLERKSFYDRAKRASVIIHTGETAQYGNIILRNGVVLPDAAGSGEKVEVEKVARSPGFRVGY